MDMAIGEGADSGDSLGPLDRAKLSSVDMEGKPALRPPRVAYLASIVTGGSVRQLNGHCECCHYANHES